MKKILVKLFGAEWYCRNFHSAIGTPDNKWYCDKCKLTFDKNASDYGPEHWPL